MPMRINDKEISYLCRLKSPGDIEGRLLYGPPEGILESRSQGFKERWFKLCGSLMFSFKLNEHGGVSKNTEPNGVFIVENCVVQLEGFEAVLFAFSVTFQGGNRVRYVFGCFSQEQAVRWVYHLRKASSSSLAAKALELEARIKQLGGKPIFEMSRFVGSPPIHRSGSMPVLSPAKLAPSRPLKPFGSPRFDKKSDNPSDAKPKSKFYFGGDSSPVPGVKSSPGKVKPSQNNLFVQSRSMTGRSMSTSLERLSKPTFKSHLSAPIPAVPPRSRNKPDRPPPPQRPSNETPSSQVPPKPETQNLIEL